MTAKPWAKQSQIITGKQPYLENSDKMRNGGKSPKDGIDTEGTVALGLRNGFSIDYFTLPVMLKVNLKLIWGYAW